MYSLAGALSKKVGQSSPTTSKMRVTSVTLPGPARRRSEPHGRAERRRRRLDRSAARRAPIEPESASEAGTEYTMTGTTERVSPLHVPAGAFAGDGPAPALDVESIRADFP